MILIVQPWLCKLSLNNPTLCLRALPKYTLNSASLGAVTSALVNQCPATIWVKNLFLISKLNLPQLYCRPLPQVLSLVTERDQFLPLLLLSKEIVDYDEVSPQSPLG
ncbi:hypothetical protein DUI87_06399 [Hirundo rustica rustica]|uniref:Uncharacterized protein n=1 Tax=Hirundo rustica rustica TaxID=333673 RepID=A0A3M0KYB7_HIRRU|nr:hypothetical protein DUI87_06399 [Hirundo rustica rustica]